jgi:hypothetical protein
MVIALTKPVYEHELLHLEINISTELGISAQKAKRKVTRYLMDHVSLFLMPANPLLVLLTENEIVWRFPIVFSPGSMLGQVGEMDVDAQSGELFINQEAISEMTHRAHRLAQITTLPAES